MRAWWKQLCSRLRWSTSAESFGKQGERAAERYVKSLGWRILARGHETQLGELDLIAADGNIVIFIEVKSRRSHAAGRPEEAVTSQKQRQLTRLGLQYLKKRGWLGKRSARFDVIAVTWPIDAKQPDIQHIKNAFEPVGVDGMFS